MVRPRFLQCLTGALAAAACGGRTPEPGGAPSDAGAHDEAPFEGSTVVPEASPPPPPPMCYAMRSPRLGLTTLEYLHSVRDLLADVVAPDGTEGFFPDDRVAGFFVNQLDNAPEQKSEQYAKAAEQLARALDAGHLDRLLPCDPAAIGEEACARAFIARFGLRAYRHPLTPAENDELYRSYSDARASSDFRTGVAAVVETALRSPHFYTLEALKEEVRPALLDPYEIASRLSYFLYRSMPDETLFAAAAAGKLGTAGEIEAQAQRMLEDPRARDGVATFFSQWLELDRLERLSQITGDPLFAAASPYMEAETTTFAKEIFFDDRKDWSDLFRSSRSWINQPLADLYGVAGVTGLDLRPVQLDPTVRAGLLTQAGVLAASTHGGEASATERGAFILDKLLCSPIPPPPAVLTIDPIKPKPGETRRQALEIATAEPKCNGCHQFTDPIGFALEAFDGFGRFRTTDNGLPIDASGSFSIQGATRPMPIRGAVELAAAIAGSNPTVPDCIGRQWFRFALRREDTDREYCSRSGPFNESLSFGFKAFLVSVASSNVFRYANGCAPACLGPGQGPL